MGADLRAAAAALDLVAADLAELGRQLDVILPAGSWRGPAAQHWHGERAGRAHDLRRAAAAVRDLSGAISARAVLLKSPMIPVTVPGRVA